MNSASIDKKFSLERVALLIRNRAYDDAPGLGIGLAILFGLNLLTILIGRTAFMNESPHEFYGAVIIGAGLLLSSFAFRGMHSGKSGTDWLLLPATPLEKYVAALASYLAAFPIAASVALVGLSAVLSLIERLAGGDGSSAWNPLTAGTARDYGEYAIMALVFMAGSAAFRRRAFLKTAALGLAFMIACAFLCLFGLWLVGGVHIGDGVSIQIDGTMTRFASVDGKVDEATLERAATRLVDVVRLVFLPIFAAAFGYLRVVEKEARDEVQ